MKPLAQVDRTSPTWLRVKEQLEERLAELRAQNDKTATEAQTEKLRGRIAEVKDLIALGNSEVTITE